MPRLELPATAARWRVAALPAACVLLNLLSVATAGAAVEEFDLQFVDGLRQRRLFSLAETFCLQRLGAPQVAGADTAQWSIELIRVYADQAVNTVGPGRAAIWEKAAEVARQFELANPDHARLPLVKVQAALALLARGELARMEAEVGAAPEQALALARTTIRQAARELEALDEFLTAAIPLATRAAPQADALTAAELSSLQQNVRYQWARALRNQALCYPAGSADRVAALTQAVKKFAQPQQVLPADDPLVARIRIDQSVCQRLLGDLKMAATVLSGLEAKDHPAAIRLAARAESLRLLIAARQLEPALAMLGKGRSINGTDSAELDFAFLEVYVEKWREAGNAAGNPGAGAGGAAGNVGAGNGAAGNGAAANKGALDWEKKSVATLEFIEQTHGPYWARRAELLLVGVNLRAGSGNVNILGRAAGDLYLKGRLDEALVAYDKAAQTALAASDTQQAFALAYKAALIQQQRQQHADARRRFQTLSLSQPTHPLAANAHLLAIVNLAQEAKSDAGRLPDYAALLGEHLRTWPSAATADTARLWLGQLHAARQQWELAIDSLTAIPFASEHFPVAVSSSTQCWSSWLEVLRGEGQPVDETARAAIAYCDAVLHRNGSKLPETWGELDGACLVSMARIQLRYLSADLDKVEQLLRVAIENAEDSATWRNAAQSLLVLAVLGKPNGLRESQRLLAQIGDASTGDLLELLAGIEQAAAGAPRLAASIGALERDVADRLLRADAQLDAAQQLRVALIRAGALVKLGDAAGALAAYADLAQKHANQASAQVAYAEQLLASDQREHLRLALAQWRRIASKTQPRTARWFRAKYSVALAYYKLDDKAAAAQRIRYLQATEDLAASGLQREFRELLLRCQ